MMRGLPDWAAALTWAATKSPTTKNAGRGIMCLRLDWNRLQVASIRTALCLPGCVNAATSFLTIAWNVTAYDDRRCGNRYATTPNADLRCVQRTGCCRVRKISPPWVISDRGW